MVSLGRIIALAVSALLFIVSMHIGSTILSHFCTARMELWEMGEPDYYINGSKILQTDGVINSLRWRLFETFHHKLGYEI
jgi:hypothetical protein